jgi:hypothetical protein
LDLVEADVIEAFETCTTNCSHPMIRDQEMFLPSHEYVFSLRQLWNMKIALSGLLLKWAKGREFSPVLQVDFVT